MKRIDCAECANLQTFEMQNSQVIINGTSMRQTTTALTCPNCGAVIAHIGDNLSEAIALEVCHMSIQQLSHINRCASCGQKLYFPSIVSRIDEPNCGTATEGVNDDK